MIADLPGPQPQIRRHCDLLGGRDRACGQKAFCAVGRAYLLLIDRENPLSRLSGRR